VSIEHIHSFPPFLNKPLPLVVNDQEIKTRILASEWADYWRPFLSRLYELFAATRPKRFLIGIGGPPGSGKSVLAEQLHWIITNGHFHPAAKSCALPMDGFHYPNHYLQNHTRKLSDGTEIPLSAVKGQPDTIDVKLFRHHLEQLLTRPDSMPWPGYSRFVHDVIPNRHHVERAVNLVIVEGNYVLVNRGPFAGIPKVFDLKIYVEAPGPKVVANLVERHMRGGKTLEQAKDWVRRIDLPNARIAESTKASADVIFSRDTGQDLSGMTWRTGEASTPIEPDVDSP
jgi:pantothenate kinase